MDTKYVLIDNNSPIIAHQVASIKFDSCNIGNMVDCDIVLHEAYNLYFGMSRIGDMIITAANIPKEDENVDSSAKMCIKIHIKLDDVDDALQHTTERIIIAESYDKKALFEEGITLVSGIVGLKTVPSLLDTYEDLEVTINAIDETKRVLNNHKNKFAMQCCSHLMNISNSLKTYTDEILLLSSPLYMCNEANNVVKKMIAETNLKKNIYEAIRKGNAIVRTMSNIGINNLKPFKDVIQFYFTTMNHMDIFVPDIKVHTKFGDNKI